MSCARDLDWLIGAGLRNQVLPGQGHRVLGKKAPGKSNVLHAIGLLRLAAEFPDVLLQ